ncbi:hypothetical protein [uncultured Roseobacter sp.]|uniref:hypothetical protein n=1 Tax=uncultured Roseobacter sp. TaxID=114847 RepID=UPI0026128BAC|nr:hypothetical protein [uncultured Roseobacter sp.]
MRQFCQWTSLLAAALIVAVPHGVLHAKCASDEKQESKTATDLKDTEYRVHWPNAALNGAAIELVYQVRTERGELPAAIDLFLRADQRQQRLYVQRLVPFEPADESGIRRVVVQLPDIVMTQLSVSGSRSAIVEVMFDPSAKVPEALPSTVSIISARIIPLK